MTTTVKIMAQGVFLPTADSVLYTSTGTAVISAFALSNTSTLAATASINLIPSAGSTATQYRIISNIDLPALTTRRLTAVEGQALTTGDKIFGSASLATTVTSFITGYVIT